MVPVAAVLALVAVALAWSDTGGAVRASSVDRTLSQHHKRQLDTSTVYALLRLDAQSACLDMSSQISTWSHGECVMISSCRAVRCLLPLTSQTDLVNMTITRDDCNVDLVRVELDGLSKSFSPGYAFTATAWNLRSRFVTLSDRRPVMLYNTNNTYAIMTFGLTVTVAPTSSAPIGTPTSLDSWSIPLLLSPCSYKPSSTGLSSSSSFNSTALINALLWTIVFMFCAAYCVCRRCGYSMFGRPQPPPAQPGMPQPITQPAYSIFAFNPMASFAHQQQQQQPKPSGSVHLAPMGIQNSAYVVQQPQQQQQPGGQPLYMNPPYQQPPYAQPYMIGGASEPPPYSPHAGGQPYYTTPQATAHYMAQMQPGMQPMPQQPTDPQTIPHSRTSSVTAPVYPAMYVYQYTQTPDGQTIATPVPVQYAVPQQMPVPVQMQPFGVASAGGSAPPSPRPDGQGPSASASASAGLPSASVYGGPSYDYDRKG